MCEIFTIFAQLDYSVETCMLPTEKRNLIKLLMQQEIVPAIGCTEPIPVAPINEDIDQTIRNMALIGNSGMQETDRMVLDIMTKK
jgi:L-cysteine desulfidase